jgi:predicted GH43/DUF377 family glycosyl hydrolase
MKKILSFKRRKTQFEIIRSFSLYQDTAHGRYAIASEVLYRGNARIALIPVLPDQSKDFEPLLLNFYDTKGKEVVLSRIKSLFITRTKTGLIASTTEQTRLKREHVLYEFNSGYFSEISRLEAWGERFKALPKQSGVYCGVSDGSAFFRTSTITATQAQYDDFLLCTSRPGYWDRGLLKLIDCLATSEGYLLIYDASSQTVNGTIVRAGAICFDLNWNEKWRLEHPVVEELILADGTLRPLGASLFEDELHILWADAVGEVFSYAVPWTHLHEARFPRISLLSKIPANPIMSPRHGKDWEVQGVFNPAVLELDGVVHMLYRAVDSKHISTLGYARSPDGVTVEYRSETPAYVPRASFEGAGVAPAKGPKGPGLYSSGGGWGGCEDPKLTLIDGRVYLTYVAYNGIHEPRVALSSISLSDFKKQRWSKWTFPKLISRPGEVNKSGCILPEKIKGNYYVFHRVFPNILIDVVPDLDFHGDTWLRTKHSIKIRSFGWDSRKLSVGATPLKTDEGWLVIYHAVDDRDPGKYKIGAMLLDLQDPHIVRYRSHHPILLPDEWYENDWKPGIAYPCGAAIIKNTLFVYYGGGDKHVCVATAPLDRFIDELKTHHEVQFETRSFTLSQ